MVTGAGRFPVSQVRGAVRLYVDNHPDGRIALWRAYDGVGKALGLEPDWEAVPSTSMEYGRVTRIRGQIIRALDALYAEDVLVKIGKGKTGPDGHELDYPVYWTRAAYDAAAEAERIKTERHDARIARWERVHDIVTGMGLENTNYRYNGDSARGRQVHLGIDDFEKLLGSIPGVQLLYTYERGQGH